MLPVETICKTGLDRVISAALAPWRKPRAVRDPGKVLLDVALAVGSDWPRSGPAVGAVGNELSVRLPEAMHCLNRELPVDRAQGDEKDLAPS